MDRHQFTKAGFGYNHFFELHWIQTNPELHLMPTAVKNFRILLVDDHIIFRDGLKALIHEMSGFDVVAEADNGMEALKLLNQISADIVISDLHMPEMNGMLLVKEIKSKFAHMKFIALTMDSNRYFIDKFLESGADGYVTKSTSAENLMNVMKNVCSEENQFLVMMSDYERQNVHRTSDEKINKLTKRELEVLELISKGLTDREIAEKIFLSTYTVTTHRKNLLSKLGLGNKVELTRFALENKIG